jgi:serine protease Do
MASSEFDTYLVLVDPSGASLAQNDDISQSDRNSRISIELPASGTYTILANGYDSNSRGRYTMTVTSP